jgi:hypothetical protein
MKVVRPSEVERNIIAPSAALGLLALQVEVFQALEEHQVSDLLDRRQRVGDAA